MFRFIAPILFVLIWSTGFIIAKTAAPHADLQLFLLIRLATTAVLMAIAATAVRAGWPGPRGLAAHALAGILMQGIYLCASYWAIARGMPAGVMSLLGALQPLFTALFVVFATGVTLGARAWSGLAIGFVGVALVLEPKLFGHHSDAMSFASVAVALFSVLGLTAGTLVQKWLPPTDLRVAASLQSLSAGVIAMLMLLWVGDGHWDGAPALWAALSWSVLVPSMIGTTILMWMMRHGEAAKVTALILLVPPLAAIQTYFFFDERLTPVQIAGFAAALGGVLLARSAPAAA